MYKEFGTLEDLCHEIEVDKHWRERRAVSATAIQYVLYCLRILATLAISCKCAKTMTYMCKA